jgi:hypothetical protein
MFASAPTSFFLFLQLATRFAICLSVQPGWLSRSKHKSTTLNDVRAANRDPEKYLFY